MNSVNRTCLITGTTSISSFHCDLASRDLDAQDRLWHKSLELTGIRAPGGSA